MSKINHTKTLQLQKRLAAIEREFQDKKRDLESVGFMSKGNVQRRMIACGKTACACTTNPDARHGPYFTWTTKIAGKTVARFLSEAEGTLNQEWIENRRRAERTIKALMNLSKKAAPIILELQRLRDERS